MVSRNFHRFITHYQKKGLTYAIYRGTKYLQFILKRFSPGINILSRERIDRNTILAGRLRAVFNVCGVKIYWDNIELTDNVGLNIAINTLGTWTDSSRGGWSILKKDSFSMIISNRWSHLPITLIWHLKIVDERKIHWKVELETEEYIKIDKKRALVLLSAQYKTWLTHDKRAQFLSSQEGGVLADYDFSESWLGVYPDENKNY